MSEIIFYSVDEAIQEKVMGTIEIQNVIADNVTYVISNLNGTTTLEPVTENIIRAEDITQQCMAEAEITEEQVIGHVIDHTGMTETTIEENVTEESVYDDQHVIGQVCLINPEEVQAVAVPPDPNLEKINALKDELNKIKHERRNSDFRRAKDRKTELISETNTLKNQLNALQKENASLRKFKEAEYDKHLAIIRTDIVQSLKDNTSLIARSNCFRLVDHSTQTKATESKLERKKACKINRINTKIENLKSKEAELREKLDQVKQYYNYTGPSTMLVKRTEYERLLYNYRVACNRERNPTVKRKRKRKGAPICMPNLESAQEYVSHKECPCVCGAIFNYSAGLAQHKKTCEVVKRIGVHCSVCGESFITTRACKRHMLCKHPDSASGANDSTISEDPEQKKDRYTCICGQGFKTCYYAYVKHRKTCDVIKEKAIFCNYCNDPFATQLALMSHIHHTHARKKRPPRPGQEHAQDGEGAEGDDGSSKPKRSRYNCLCGLYFHHSFENYTQHTRTCAIFKASAHYCDACGNAFKTKLALNHHIARKHREKESEKSEWKKIYKCACGEHFKTNHKLWAHGETCEQYQMKAITCPHCSRTYPSKHALGQHHRRAHKDLLYIVLQ